MNEFSVGSFDISFIILLVANLILSLLASKNKNLQKGYFVFKILFIVYVVVMFVSTMISM